MNDFNPVKKTLEIIGTTKEKLAKALGITRQTLDNYEKDPSKIPYSVIMIMTELTGCSPEVLMGGGAKSPQGPSPTEYHSKATATGNAICAGLATLNDSLDRIDGADDKIFTAERTAAKEEIANLIYAIKKSNNKPVVCCFGESDSGKSSLLNFLIGEKIIPARYCPVTSVPTVIHHIEDKPDYLAAAEDSIVFGRKLNKNRRPDAEEPFTHLKYDISKYQDVKDHIIREGDHESILKAYATRDGAYYNNADFNYIIDEVHIYLNNEILKEITLVDIPGFNTGVESDDVGLTMNMSAFDIVLYLSPAISFMRPEDIAALQQILRAKSPVGANGEEIIPVFVLATHANAVGDPEEIRGICENGYNRVVEGMSDTDKQRLMIGEDGSILRDCFIGMDIFNKKLTEGFNDKFIKCLEAVREYKNACFKKHFHGVFEALREKYQSKADNIEGPITKEEHDESIKTLEKKHKQMKKEVESKIDSLRDKNCKLYEEECEKILDVDNLLKLIDKKGIKNNKKDRQDFANYINNRINNVLTGVLEFSSKEFNETLDTELASIKKADNIAGFNVSMASFDARSVFVSGLTGVSTFGALAAWSSAVAAGSNLGGYILLAKVVSALSSIGISLGGTATVATAISAIGGPVTLGIGLSVITAVSAFGIMGGTWKKSFAKKLNEAFSKNDVIGKGKECIEKYWSDTRQAYERCEAQLFKAAIEFINAKYEQSELNGENAVKLNILLKMMYGTLNNYYADSADKLMR
ncbi:MAG: dynamin family protein [Clostridia bacterium]|nr:dynamin family protein [Clostridia bacterium]